MGLFLTVVKEIKYTYRTLDNTLGGNLKEHLRIHAIIQSSDNSAMHKTMQIQVNWNSHTL